MKRNDKRLTLHRKIVAVQGNQCFYCGIKMIGWSPSRRVYIQKRGDVARMVTIEHIKPASSGGMRTKGNVVLACFSCNTKRGTQTLRPEELRRAKELNDMLELGANVAWYEQRIGHPALEEELA